MQHPEPVARRLFELTEPISLVNFFSQEPNDSMAALASATTGTATSRDAPRRSAGSRPRSFTRPSTASPTARWPATWMLSVSGGALEYRGMSCRRVHL